jgi:hypothetical protein
MKLGLGGPLLGAWGLEAMPAPPDIGVTRQAFQHDPRAHRACVLAGCWLAPQNRGFGLLLLLQS